MFAIAAVFASEVASVGVRWLTARKAAAAWLGRVPSSAGALIAVTATNALQLTIGTF